MWYQKILEGNRDKLSKNIRDGAEKVDALTELYQGIGVKKSHVIQSLKTTGLTDTEFDDFEMGQTKEFAKILRKISKPTLIVANKIDVPGADKNFNRLRERYNEVITVPASADSELTLRRAEQQDLIKYSPGSEQFDILGLDDIRPQQDVTLIIRDQNGTRKVKLLCRIDTPIEVDYFMHGGILPYVLKELMTV